MSESWLLLSLIAVALSPPIFLGLRFAIATHFVVSPSTLVRCFVTGMLSILPVLFWSQYIHPLIPAPTSYLAHAFWRAGVQAALPEEILKFVWLAGFCVPRYGLPSRAAGMAMGATVALGFATFENVLYVFQEGFATGFLRAFTSVPIHAGMGAIMGYFLARASFFGARRDLGLSLALPIVIHTLYNFPLMLHSAGGSQADALSFSMLVLTLVILWVRMLLRRELRNDQRLSRQARAMLPPLPR